MRVLIIMTLFPFYAFSQCYEIYNPNLHFGLTKDALWNNWDKDVVALEKYSDYQAFEKLKLEPSKEKTIDISYSNEKFKYAFYTDIKSSASESPPFYIQRIKRNTKHETNSGVYANEDKKLVEVFKSFDINFYSTMDTTGLEDVHSSLRRSDLHWGEISRPLDSRVTKTITKQFQIGIGTMRDKFSELNHEEFRLEENGKTYYTIYWGTGYQKNNEYYNQVEFESYVTYNLTLILTSKTYSIEVPELGIFESGVFED